MCKKSIYFLYAWRPLLYVGVFEIRLPRRVTDFLKSAGVLRYKPRPCGFQAFNKTRSAFSAAIAIHPA